MSNIEDEETNVLVNLLLNNDCIDEVAFAFALCKTKKEREEMIKFLSDMIDKDGELNSEKIMDKLEQDNKVTIIRNQKTKEKPNKKTKEKSNKKQKKKQIKNKQKNKRKTKQENKRK